MLSRLPAPHSRLRGGAATALAAVVLCVFAAVGRADTIAFTKYGGAGAKVSGDWGWEFSITSPISVTELGLLDSSGSGLSASHEIGIWSSGGTLEGSGTVASGTTDPITGGFRYTTLSQPIILQAGTYTIAALYASDDALSYLDYGSVASGLTYLGSERNSSATTFTMPTTFGSTGSQYSYFGPNFEFSTTIPATTAEPASLLTMGTGMLSLAGLLRRRNGRKASV
jgi:hypothetical protein